MKAITILCFIFSLLFCTAFSNLFYLQSVGYSSQCYCLTFDRTSEFGLILDTCGPGSKQIYQDLYDAEKNGRQIIFIETLEVMDVFDGIGEGGKDDGRPILHFEYRGGGNQYWIIDDLGARGWTFKNSMTGGYLSANAADRTKISQARQVTGDYQIWRASSEPNCIP